jgi:hypothetical protein
MSDICFDHERLDVYRVGIDVTVWVGELLEGPLADCKLNAVNQLDRASTSNTAQYSGGKWQEIRKGSLSLPR